MNTRKTAQTMCAYTIIFGALLMASTTYTDAVERVVRVREQPQQNGTGRIANEAYWNGSMRAPPALTFDVYTVFEMNGHNSRLIARMNELASQIAAQETRNASQDQALSDLRRELLTRIGNIPVELARDEEAYRLLQQRLTRDLYETFGPKGETSVKQ